VLYAKNKVGLTAGASAPEYLVQDVIQWLAEHGGSMEELDLIEEDVNFALPTELTELLPETEKEPLRRDSSPYASS